MSIRDQLDILVAFGYESTSSSAANLNPRTTPPSLTSLLGQAKERLLHTGVPRTPITRSVKLLDFSKIYARQTTLERNLKLPFQGSYRWPSAIKNPRTRLATGAITQTIAAIALQVSSIVGNVFICAGSKVSKFDSGVPTEIDNFSLVLY